MGDRICRINRKANPLAREWVKACSSLGRPMAQGAQQEILDRRGFGQVDLEQARNLFKVGHSPAQACRAAGGGAGLGEGEVARRLLHFDEQPGPGAFVQAGLDGLNSSSSSVSGKRVLVSSQAALARFSSNPSNRAPSP